MPCEPARRLPEPRPGGPYGALEERPLDQRTLLVAVRGTAGRAAIVDVNRAVLRAVRAGRTRVIVDLSELTDAAPGLLGALLRIRRRLLGVGGDLAVVMRASDQPLLGDERGTALLGRRSSLAEARASLVA